jgi:hypothetical protein
MSREKSILCENSLAASLITAGVPPTLATLS